MQGPFQTQSVSTQSINMGLVKGAEKLLDISKGVLVGKLNVNFKPIIELVEVQSILPV